MTSSEQEKFRVIKYQNILNKYVLQRAIDVVPDIISSKEYQELSVEEKIEFSLVFSSKITR